MSIEVAITIKGTLDNGDAIKSRAGSKVYTGISNLVEGDIQIGNSAAATILTIGAAVAGSTLTALNFLYVKNNDVKDSTKILTVGLISTGADTVYVHLAQGEWITICDGQIDTNVAGGVAGTFVGITSVTAQSSTGNIPTSITAY